MFELGKTLASDNHVVRSEEVGQVEFGRERDLYVLDVLAGLLEVKSGFLTYEEAELVHAVGFNDFRQELGLRVVDLLAINKDDLVLVQFGR